MNDKELLLKDLCSRLPYGVKVLCLRDFTRKWYNLEMVDIGDNEVYLTTTDESYTNRYVEIDEVKPYLFPLSSMTEEQRSEASIEFNLKKYMVNEYGDIESYHRIEDDIAYIDVENISRYIDWLNKNHFDYRNLINKNLAIDCTNLNIY